MPQFSNQQRNRLKTKYGPWALVTGASSGIGKELAICLADAGLNVILIARRKALLNELSENLKDQYQVDTLVVEADLSDEQEVHQVIAQIQDIDVGLLVAAAGFGTSGLLIHSKLEDELNMLDLNCRALFIFSHHFAKRFVEQGRGGIILLSSMVGFQGVPNAAHYAATKAYVQSLGEALSVELKSRGVDVLAAAPGPVETGFMKRADMKAGAALKPQDIALPILKALGHRSTILPGFLTKFLVGLLRTVPRWAKVRIMNIVMGGMTKHQQA